MTREHRTETEATNIEESKEGYKEREQEPKSIDDYTG